MMERVMNRLNLYTAHKPSTLQGHVSDERSSTSLPGQTELGNFLGRYAYSHLSSLIRKSVSGVPAKKSPVSHPLTVEELEMLEAELINQGILNPDVDALSKRVRRELSLLLWNAKRSGVTLDQINFRIDLESFILFEVTKLCPYESHSHKSSNPVRQKLKNELRYLDQFASYLNGEFEEPESGYEKGLNVVLKAIMMTQGTQEKSRAEIILPISKQEFLNAIGTYPSGVYEAIEIERY